MSRYGLEAIGKRHAAAIIDVRLTAYQLTVAGLKLPVPVHAVFNAVMAGGMVLLGHLWLAAALFVGATAIDAVKQVLLTRWFNAAAAGPVDEAAGFRKLALLCIARVTVYTTPTFIMAIQGGVAEFAYYGIQLATLLAVAMGGGALSRMTFWAMSGPQILQVAVMGFLLFDPLTGAAITIALLILFILMATISESTVTAITTWHEAFVSNVALLDDLAAARDAARHANRSKSAFLATMSHEIRTPMNGVLGMAQLLKRDESDPVQAQRLDVLIESGEYLLSILNDILDVSKIDAGKLEIVTAPQDIRNVLERLIAFWSARAEERGVTLGLDIDPELPSRLSIDVLRLRQVLFNLVGNALKFTEQGVVEIAARVASRDGDTLRLHLAVRDTGAGIAPQHLPALFDRFSQADESEIRRFGGTGLGLAIVRQLVELMGGRVWVESELGCGSTFHVEIPVEAVADGAAGADEPATTGGMLSLDGLRVLAVDDNAVNLLVLDQLLSSLGCSVERAASGAEAVEAMAEVRFDLVLSDIQMPQMTGTELLQHIRATPGPNQAVPVIALTADVTSGGRQRYLELGFTEHSTKPIQLQDLLDAILRAAAAEPPGVAEVA